MPETPEGATSDVFGPGSTDDLFSDFVTETPETPEPAAAEGQPPAEIPQNEPVPEPEPKQPAEPEAPTTPEEAPEGEQDQTPPEQPGFAIGNFKGPDAETVARQAHAAWENSQRLMTQRAQEAAQIRREHAELVEMLKRSEPLLRQAAELQGQTQPVDLSQLDPEDPNYQQVVQAYIDQRAAQIADERISQQIRPLQEAQDQQRLQQGYREIEAFRRAHPDAVAYEPQIASVIAEYRQDPDGQEVFPPNRENFAVAYTLVTRPEVKALVDQTDYIPDPELVAHAQEAVDNPALKEVIEANPAFMTSDKGMAFARKLAGLPQVVSQAQQTQTQESQATAQAGRAAAHVEIDEGPESVAPGKKPQDPLEEALFEDLAKEQAGSIFR